MKTHHDACYPYLWCPTMEDERFIRENRAKFDDDEVEFFCWDIISGMNLMRKTEEGAWVWGKLADDIKGNPLKALESIEGIPENSVVFLKDYHKYFQDIKVIRQALNLKEHLKHNAKTLVFVGPTGQNGIPIELGHDITMIDFEYPDRDALLRKFEIIARDNEVPVPDNHEAIVDALQGMTIEGAENALAYSLVKTGGKFDVKILLDEKARQLKATGYLRYGQFSETFDNLYGMDVLQNFVRGTIESPEARGVLLYGVPGCGKSHFAKALANEYERALLEFKLGNIRSKWQGESQTRLVDALKQIESFGRPIVFVDEIEKAVAGSESSQVDGGSGARILGELLSYWEDRKENGSYWICTANNLDEMLHLSGGAMIRRFDAIFFIDMPTPSEAKGIAEIWNRLKGVEIPEAFNFTNYTGADIRKLATNMKMLDKDAKEASNYVIPYGVANPNELKVIQKKAKGVCIWATSPETHESKRRVANIRKDLH